MGLSDAVAFVLSCFFFASLHLAKIAAKYSPRKARVVQAQEGGLPNVSNVYRKPSMDVPTRHSISFVHVCLIGIGLVSG